MTSVYGPHDTGCCWLGSTMLAWSRLFHNEVELILDEASILHGPGAHQLSMMLPFPPNELDIGH